MNSDPASLLGQEDGLWCEPSRSHRGPGWLPNQSVFSLSLQDPFVAFHINKGLVRKYMNSLLIGELSPEQPSFEPTKNVRLCCLGTLWFVEGQAVEKAGLARFTGDHSQ